MKYLYCGYIGENQVHTCITETCFKDTKDKNVYLSKFITKI